MVVDVSPARAVTVAAPQEPDGTELTVGELCSMWITITDGHGGRVIATSAGQHFRWKIEPKVGLTFELDLLTMNEFEWPGPCDVSIDMKPLGWNHRYVPRGFVREITAMRLDHIALLRPSQRRDGA